MRFLTRRVLISSLAVGTVGGGAVAYYSAKAKSNSNNNEKKTSSVLTGEEFNKLQNQKVLSRVLGSGNGYLPWGYAGLTTRYTKESCFPFCPADEKKPVDSDTAGLARYNDIKEVGAGEDTATSGVAAPTKPYSYSSKDFELTFYRLLGCPFCSKVEAVLFYHNVPYKEIIIDPINGKGLPFPQLYELAPQLRFRSLVAGKDKGAEVTKRDEVFLVESSVIVDSLAAPLRYTKDLSNSNVKATRSWITQHFHGASFVLANSSFSNAYKSYSYLTPEKYRHNIFYHAIGSAALYLLAVYKIRPSVTLHEANKKYLQSQDPTANAKAASAGAGGEDKKDKDKEPGIPSSNEEWLKQEINVFFDLCRQNNKKFNPDSAAAASDNNNSKNGNSGASVFHSNNGKPDIADVEFYGVTRVLAVHPYWGPFLKEKCAPFKEWQEGVEHRQQQGNK